MKHYKRNSRGGDISIKTSQEKTLGERLDKKLQGPDPITGCIEWIGSKHKFGYGILQFKTKMWLTHRAAWESKHGPIPDSLHVLHRCDNPPCCNPDHLFLGTRADNVADMNSKGRNGLVKLTPKNILEIAKLLKSGKQTQANIGFKFGVSRQTINLISTGKKLAKSVEK